MHEANEILNPNPILCDLKTRAADIKYLLKKYGVEEILVVDVENHNAPIGVVGELDLFKMEEGLISGTQDYYAQDCMRAIQRVQPDCSLDQCRELMKESHLNFLACTNESGELIGIVHLEDVERVLH